MTINKKILIFTATYNEAENIGRLLEKLIQQKFKVQNDYYSTYGYTHARVQRGGAYETYYRWSRVAHRSTSTSHYALSYFGFRLVRTLK